MHVSSWNHSSNVVKECLHALVRQLLWKNINLERINSISSASLEQILLVLLELVVCGPLQSSYFTYCGRQLDTQVNLWCISVKLV